METPPSSYDYEQIVKLLDKRDADSEELENKKNILRNKQWTTLKNHHELIELLESAENINNTIKSLITEQTALRNIIDKENENLNKEMQTIQEMYNVINAKSKSKSEAFFNNAETLCQEFDNMPLIFNNDSMHQRIKDCMGSITIYKQEIAAAEEEMKRLQNMRKSDNLELYFSVAEVTKVIQKDSLKHFGNPTKLQGCLAELTNNNVALVKEIQDIKVKYGI